MYAARSACLSGRFTGPKKNKIWIESELPLVQTSSVESSDARWAKIAETMIPYTAQAVEAVEAKERIRSSRAAHFESKAGEAGLGSSPAAAGSGARACRCVKSRCLRLYCVCFRAGGLCSAYCECADCQNNGEHEGARNHAIETLRALAKPERCMCHALICLIQTPQLSHSRNIISSCNAYDTAPDAEHSCYSANKPGCRCKNSGCIKKYCECFARQTHCSDKCVCQGCKNTLERFKAYMGFDSKDNS